MGIEYKARPAGTAGRPKRRGGKACGFWFVFGLVLGGFGVGLYLMLRPPIPVPGAAGPEQAKTPTQAQPGKAVPTPGAPTRFDFHDILPELEVVVSDNEMSKPDPKRPDDKKKDEEKKVAEDKKADGAKKPDPTKPDATKTDPTKTADTGPGTYMVQIASLRTAADAERLKAQLAMQGIHAKVQSITVNGKETYHRVQAGPYQSKQAVNEVRGQLKAKGLETIPVKVK
jgi:cell division protein FtsN